MCRVFYQWGTPGLSSIVLLTPPLVVSNHSIGCPVAGGLLHGITPGHCAHQIQPVFLLPQARKTRRVSPAFDKYCIVTFKLCDIAETYYWFNWYDLFMSPSYPNGALLEEPRSLSVDKHILCMYGWNHCAGATSYLCLVVWLHDSVCWVYIQQAVWWIFQI